MGSHAENETAERRPAPAKLIDVKLARRSERPARPVEHPKRIAIRLIAKAPIQPFAGYELRAVAVNRPDDVAVIPMDDEGWPLA